MIVVGVDYSEGSAGAVRFARDLARPRGEALHLVHVDAGEEPDDVADDRRTAWLRYLSVGSSEIEHRKGVPWVELVRVATERGARVVVAGTHGQTGFQPLRLGTTATNVALRSGKPVVLVPPRRDGANMDSRNRGKKMKHAKRSLVSGMVLVAALSMAGCGKKPPPAAPAPAPASQPQARDDAGDRARREAEARAAEEAARRELARKRSVLEEMVFFDYDDSRIRTDARSTLDAKARTLRDDGSIRLRVVGHADERGSTEYNLALGMRRAQSIKDYLAGYGISADRLEIQTMGEERPLATGHDEASWSRNRRGEFSILAGLRAGG